MNSKFGWSYPAGAENDQNAPYNQTDDPLDYFEENRKVSNRILAEAFIDFEGPGELQRAVYKYTDCGPTVGALIRYIQEPEDEFGSPQIKSRYIYTNDLYKLCTWTTEHPDGTHIVQLVVSSIVEGTDEVTDTIRIDLFDTSLGEEIYECTLPSEDIAAAFWEAVEDVNTQATDIWNETHGCAVCARHYGLEGETTYSPVWKDCPECNGSGVVI